MRLHPSKQDGHGGMTNCSDAALAWPLFLKDPLASRVPLDRAVDLIGRALKMGDFAAGRLCAELGPLNPFEAAETLGVKTIVSEKASDGGKALTVLAGYQPEPPAIVIHETTLRRLAAPAAGWARTNVDSLVARLAQICVAHELYHHHEKSHHMHANLLHQETVLDLGLLKVRKSMQCLSEIAAHAFAKKFLGLPFLPCCLDACLEYAAREGGAGAAPRAAVFRHPASASSSRMTFRPQ